jgi:hypothetical protein
VEIRLRGGEQDARSAVTALERIDGVRAVTSAPVDAGIAVLFVESAQDRRAEVCRALVEAGWDVVRLERSRQKLESMFLELVGGATDGSHRNHPAA